MGSWTLGDYATPGAMTTLPQDVTPTGLPTDPDDLRHVVQGLLLHRDWAPHYGVSGDAIRLDEQHLRSTADVLRRAVELSSEPLTRPRAPADRVLGICRHFTLLHTAFLRSQGTPARVRCGFSNYFDRAKWYDHWITERWDGARWVRDDPQVDELQAEAVGLDFDPYDQPPGQFLAGPEAWIAARAGDVDPSLFGIFDMWGLGFIGGNVVTDFACLNKVELLPWDLWGLKVGDPNRSLTDEIPVLDEVATLATSGDLEAIHERYLQDLQLRVPARITTMVDGEPVAAELQL